MHLLKESLRAVNSEYVRCHFGLSLVTSCAPKLCFCTELVSTRKARATLLQYQRFRKGVGGMGLATNKPPKRAQKVLQKCVPIFLRGHRKKGTERGLNLWSLKGFFAPTPSVRQPLFETSDSSCHPLPPKVHCCER